MFTGLIEKVGKLDGLARTSEGGRIQVQCEPWPDPLVLGESVAVQGVCLTVVESRGGGFVCDVLGETLQRTTLGIACPGSRLNLERAMRADGRFGGHMLTGHVDGTGEIADVHSTGRDWELDVRCDESLLEGIVRKGSVACDGVSLTVAAVRADGFTVNIIPFTWQHTSLCRLQRGDALNLENDIVGKYVRKYVGELGCDKTTITADKLAAAGFGQ